MSIDDFRLQFAQTSADQLAGTIPDGVQKQLRREYGAGAGLVRIGL